MRKYYTLITILIVTSLNAQELVLNIADDTGSTQNSDPANLFVSGSSIYFIADVRNDVTTGTDTGKELWLSNGTTMGTNFVKDIRVGTSSGSPNNFFEYNGNVYFTAFDGSSSDLWTTDGTETGTVKVDLFPGVNEAVQRPIELNGIMYMTGIVTPGDSNDLIAWNGTTASNANSVADDESILSTMAILNGKLYLYMSLSSDNQNDLTDAVASQDNIGVELYEFDPSTNLFSLVKDVAPGATFNSGAMEYRANNSGISNLTTLGSKVYFEADNALWETDGTELGTFEVAVASTQGISGVRDLFAWDGNLYFEGDDGNGDQLWKYDLTFDTVTNISNISGGANTDHDPSSYVAYDSYLYYKGKDAVDSNLHLFRTNGSTIEQAFSDVDLGSSNIVLLNNKLYFEADANDGSGDELYSFDPITLSVETFDATDTLSIYPNPSNYGVVNIKGNLINANYTIYDINGRNVAEGSITDNQIRHSLYSGVYILNISTDNNTKSFKLVVD